ncbi:hypothetical protein C8A00DRAFT_15042 [Chaetomidium leptoderma]|uniref:Uncharacterized protein n=1 Tax=Chaetomidium leptoderma TaxID=669021 RepID=A0AAN6VM77_9PEZI|nr:hypothetical protein C8A00DRAFT_15042 [Chaetomidium leptoderma]
MKSAIIAVALAFGISASATIRIEYGPDGSFKAISTPDTHTPAPAPGKLARSAGCSSCRDKCLRAVVSASSSDPDFCSSFLVATSPSLNPVHDQCAGQASRVSSACSCLVNPVGYLTQDCSRPPTLTPSISTTSFSSTESSSSTSPTPTAPPCSPPGSLCTIDNFIEVCCHNADESVGCMFNGGNPQDGRCFI